MTYDSRTKTITLKSGTGSADTLADFGVHFVHTSRAIAKQSDASTSLLADWQTLESWLGCAGRELNQADDIQIGDAYRSYLAKGQAPSIALDTIFRSFAQQAKNENWVLVHVPLQIESVFNRMLATDEEIEAKRQIEPKQLKAEDHIDKVSANTPQDLSMCGPLVVLPDLTSLQAQQVVHAYGKVISEIGGMIADERRLPVPKDVIKQAILMVLPFSASENIRKTLTSAYLYLADFQPGVGDKPLSRVMTKSALPRTKEELAALTKAESAALDKELQAVSAKLDNWMLWSKRTTVELKELIRELQDAGFRD